MSPHHLTGMEREQIAAIRANARRERRRVERQERSGRQFITFTGLRLWPGNTVVGVRETSCSAKAAFAADPAAARAYEVADDSDPAVPGHSRLLVVRVIER